MLPAGNAIVAKPVATSRPLLAATLNAAGIPDGVVNLVYGTDPIVGEAITKHRRLDMVSFTGSTAAGTLISVPEAGTAKGRARSRRHIGRRGRRRLWPAARRRPHAHHLMDQLRSGRSRVLVPATKSRAC
ncbi:aldehyde dehydrogenase family protein [Amycolatopsis sp. NPDC001319]|uniref:aldehyde dehydrogenase family protein n=1 Tax=unclassified Amycolatopsis TaxID=2618356 RepID=UPI0036891C67